MRQGKNVAEDRRLDPRSEAGGQLQVHQQPNPAASELLLAMQNFEAAPRHTGTRCGAPHGRVACRQGQGIIPTTSLEIASPEAPAAYSLERPPRVSRRGEMAEVHGTGCMDRLACFEFDEDPGD